MEKEDLIIWKTKKVVAWPSDRPRNVGNSQLGSRRLVLVRTEECFHLAPNPKDKRKVIILQLK